ncbi:hypothetical protein [Gluconobacter oxydans]|uniref:hypothetical protein n=1 Tax=Gluconobacter oxydans TaxID=442 RepID=UPI00062C7D27|nr:hypothetical protein [Gluconobacter oxydans]
MSTDPTDLNSPLPIQICNQDGTLTAQGKAFLRRLWERTGYAPGTDSTWTAMEADIAVLAAARAQSVANAALAEAKAALELAEQVLLHATSIRAEAAKALELSEDSAILSVTARGNAQAAQSPDESMIFSIMKP